MGQSALINYLSHIQKVIGRLLDSVEPFQAKVKTFQARVRDGIDVEESQALLHENEVLLAKTTRDVEALKRFFLAVVQKWGSPNNRIIGHVLWSPPIGVGVEPDGYTRDLCVVELYKSKFKHMIGNVLSLGMSPMSHCCCSSDHLPCSFIQGQNWTNKS